MMVYTQVAGAACGVLPRGEDGQRAYRLWVDYSLAAYLWEALAAIAADILEAALTDRSLNLCGKSPSLNVHRALVAYQTLSGRR